ncbi:MAG: fatty acid hydroxylase, partial [Rhodospirillales bacterium]|nr:fatty acid hydroxylase [Rhodospirillales bacterium]
MLELLDIDWRRFLAMCGTLGAVVLIARQLERKWPAELTQPRSEVLMDFKLVAVTFFMNWLNKPIAALSTISLINASGGGLITLRSDTWWGFAFSLVTFTVANDLYSYWSHRLSHVVPA